MKINREYMRVMRTGKQMTQTQRRNIEAGVIVASCAFLCLAMIILFVLTKLGIVLL